MNTFWFFGDSTTNHYGLTETHDWFALHKNKKEYFTTILSDKFNKKLKNLSIDGASNDVILHSIVRNLKNIKKGDMVFIQTTGSLRFNTFENGHFQTIHGQYLEMHKNELSKEKIKTLNEYVKHFMIDNEEAIDMYSFSFYFNLYSYFVSIGVVPIILHHSIFQEHIRHSFNLTTIEEESNGVVNDKHIGFESQRRLAKIISNEISNNNFILIPNSNHKNLRNKDYINKIIKKGLFN